MKIGISPLGTRFNPFDPDVQSQLNDAVAAINRLKAIEADLQRVVVQTWPEGGGAAGLGSTGLVLIGLEVDGVPETTDSIPNYHNRWYYPWRTAVYNPATTEVDEDIGGINSLSDGETKAINLFEVNNQEFLVNAGVDITSTAESLVTAGPLANDTPALILTLGQVDGVTHRGFWPVPIPINVSCTGGVRRSRR